MALLAVSPLRNYMLPDGTFILLQLPDGTLNSHTIKICYYLTYLQMAASWEHSNLVKLKLFIHNCVLLANTKNTFKNNMWMENWI